MQAADLLEFTPDDNGTYSITLTATDGNGSMGTTSQTLAVSNVPPTPSIDGPASGLEGTAMGFTGSATDPSTADTTAGFTFASDVTKVHGSTTTSGYRRAVAPV